MNQMLQELQIPQPFFFDPLRKGEEMHSEVNHSLTPGNPFDWVFMDTHLGQKVSSYDSAQRMYALLYEEILDGRIGFRSFTGNNFAERKAGAAGIPCIRWTDARELCRLYDVLRREAEDRRILQESIAASHV
jgi:hypothetical protein